MDNGLASIINMESKSESKRKRSGKEMESDKKTDEIAAKKHCVDTSPILQAFQQFQVELDVRHDKYERIVKTSRDITIQSKRIIFLLHRGFEEKTRGRVLKEAEEKFVGIKELFQRIAEELENEDSYQFIRAYSSGLQEFIEAYSFWFFLKDGSLVAPEVICEKLLTFKKEEDGVEKDIVLLVPPLEYVLGIADLTGELMRLCINCVGKGNLKAPYEICQLLRNIHDAFVTFGKKEKGLSRKLQVMIASLKKVENTCYTITIRGSEVPEKMLASLVANNMNSEAPESVV